MKAIANFKSEIPNRESQISNLKFQISDIRYQISNFRSELSNSRPWRGMTLVELLVVVTIIMLLAAVTIPQLRPEMDKTRIREAARSIQLYLSSARSLAMSTGRSCGVMLERLPADNGCSMTLTQVETPPMYGGDTTTATATVTQVLPPSNDGLAHCRITISPPPSVPLYRLDQIQIGYQGFWITLDQNNPAGGANGAITNPASLTGTVDISHGETPAWITPAGASQPVSITAPFSVRRWPTKSIAAALQLPTPACIDLTWSGTDDPSTQTWLVANTPVTIMFAPDGSVDKTYVNVNVPTGGQTYQAVSVITSIYLLIGDRSHVYDSPVGNTDSNLNNITNLWVGINASTGRITVSEMTATNSGTALTLADLQQTRLFARQSAAMGGK